MTAPAWKALMHACAKMIACAMPGAGSYNPEDRRGSKKSKSQAMDELVQVVRAAKLECAHQQDEVNPLHAVIPVNTAG
jgi:hypothetical protein